VVNFYAPIDPSHPDAEIMYDFKAIGEDVELLMKDEYKYCLKQCYKMSYFISKLYAIEVLKMTCEFLKDDNESIWFSYAYNIISRNISGREVGKNKVKQL
jgi:hypothetical protein